MIYKFLKEHAKKQPISFHMPGHKGAALYHKYGYGDFFTDLADLDITEIPGADNLFQAEDIIQSVQEAYRELYQVKASYLLINGTSGGLIAAILATVPRGKKLIMARNCHKSVFNALTLGGIEPVYAYPEEGPVAGPISPQEIEALLKANPDGEAVILPSPNYYGICSDIEAIAKIVHQAGKVLIVDQAHGAHLKFFHRYVKDSVGKLPLAAEDAG
ncbi:MAG: aminotransferase class I/II-fold pyridoxal phosphate-dependent enzyme, partial [Anaerovoracaceae bacterium]